MTGEEDVVAAVMKLTGGAGARIVFDPVGGPGVTQFAAAMARGGILFQYGGLSAEPTLFPAWEVVGKSLTMCGYGLFEIVMDPVEFAEVKQFVADGLLAGKLRPVIAKRFVFADIAEAYRYLIWRATSRSAKSS